MLFFRLPGGSTGTVGKNNLPHFLKIILVLALMFKDLITIMIGIQDQLIISLELSCLHLY